MLRLKIPEDNSKFERESEAKMQKLLGFLWPGFALSPAGEHGLAGRGVWPSRGLVGRDGYLLGEVLEGE